MIPQYTDLPFFIQAFDLTQSPVYRYDIVQPYIKQRICDFLCYIDPKIAVQISSFIDKLPLEQANIFLAQMGVDFATHILSLFIHKQDIASVQASLDPLLISLLYYGEEKASDDLAIFVFDDVKNEYYFKHASCVKLFNDLALQLIDEQITLPQALAILQEPTTMQALNEVQTEFHALFNHPHLPFKLNNPNIAMLFLNLIALYHALGELKRMGKKPLPGLTKVVNEAKKALYNRYEGMNQVLTDPNADIKTTIPVRKQTILTDFTFWYNTACWLEQNTDRDHDVDSNLSVLIEIINNSTALIGAYNDIGLMSEYPVEKAQMLLNTERGTSYTNQIPREVLKQCIAIPQLTRIASDSKGNEYNTVLSSHMNHLTPQEQWKQLWDNIVNYQVACTHYNQNLHNALATTQGLPEEIVHMITRFVRFNKELYSIPKGDYDISMDTKKIPVLTEI